MCRLLDAHSFWQTILVNCMQLHGKQEQWIQHMDFLAPVLGYCNDASDLGTSFCAITGSDQHYHFHRSLVAHITWSSSDFFFFGHFPLYTSLQSHFAESSIYATARAKHPSPLGAVPQGHLHQLCPTHVKGNQDVPCSCSAGFCALLKVVWELNRRELWIKC